MISAGVACSAITAVSGSAIEETWSPTREMLWAPQYRRKAGLAQQRGDPGGEASRRDGDAHCPVSSSGRAAERPQQREGQVQVADQPGAGRPESGICLLVDVLVDHLLGLLTQGGQLVRVPQERVHRTGPPGPAIPAGSAPRASSQAITSSKYRSAITELSRSAAIARSGFSAASGRLVNMAVARQGRSRPLPPPALAIIPYLASWRRWKDVLAGI